MGEFKGKKAIVTGGAKGIGKAIACRLLQEGVEVVVLDLDTSSFFDKHKDKVHHIVMDVGDTEAWDRVSQSVDEVDYLVNNAGVQTIEPFQELAKESWDKVIRTNLNGTFWGMQKIKIKPNGRIINLSSIHAQKPRLEKFHYDATKAAIEMLTKEAAIVFASDKITVNAIACGAIDTPMNESWTSDETSVNNVVLKIPLGRLGTAEDIADAAMFLLSPKASYITGSVITVDGGRSLV